jgi:hypothetical protein
MPTYYGCLPNSTTTKMVPRITSARTAITTTTRNTAKAVDLLVAVWTGRDSSSSLAIAPIVLGARSCSSLGEAGAWR